jgi:hypothetical protein
MRFWNHPQLGIVCRYIQTPGVHTYWRHEWRAYSYAVLQARSEVSYRYTLFFTTVDGWNEGKKPTLLSQDLQANCSGCSQPCCSRGLPDSAGPLTAAATYLLAGDSPRELRAFPSEKAQIRSALTEIQNLNGEASSRTSRMLSNIGELVTTKNGTLRHLSKDDFDDLGVQGEVIEARSGTEMITVVPGWSWLAPPRLETYRDPNCQRRVAWDRQLSLTDHDLVIVTEILNECLRWHQSPVISNSWNQEYRYFLRTSSQAQIVEIDWWIANNAKGDAACEASSMISQIKEIESRIPQQSTPSTAMGGEESIVDSLLADLLFLRALLVGLLCTTVPDTSKVAGMEYGRKSVYIM